MTERLPLQEQQATEIAYLHERINGLYEHISDLEERNNHIFRILEQTLRNVLSDEKETIEIMKDFSKNMQGVIKAVTSKNKRTNETFEFQDRV